MLGENDKKVKLILSKVEKGDILLIREREYGTNRLRTVVKYPDNSVGIIEDNTLTIDGKEYKLDYYEGYRPLKPTEQIRIIKECYDNNLEERQLTALDKKIIFELEKIKRECIILRDAYKNNDGILLGYKIIINKVNNALKNPAHNINLSLILNDVHLYLEKYETCRKEKECYLVKDEEANEAYLLKMQNDFVTIYSKESYLNKSRILRARNKELKELFSNYLDIVRNNDTLYKLETANLKSKIHEYLELLSDVLQNNNDKILEKNRLKRDDKINKEKLILMKKELNEKYANKNLLSNNEKLNRKFNRLNRSIDGYIKELYDGEYLFLDNANALKEDIKNYFILLEEAIKSERKISTKVEKDENKAEETKVTYKDYLEEDKDTLKEPNSLIHLKESIENAWKSKKFLSPNHGVGIRIEKLKSFLQPFIEGKKLTDREYSKVKQETKKISDDLDKITLKNALNKAKENVNSFAKNSLNNINKVKEEIKLEKEEKTYEKTDYILGKYVTFLNKWDKLDNKFSPLALMLLNYNSKKAHKKLSKIEKKIDLHTYQKKAKVAITSIVKKMKHLEKKNQINKIYEKTNTVRDIFEKLDNDSQEEVFERFMNHSKRLKVRLASVALSGALVLGLFGGSYALYKSNAASGKEYSKRVEQEAKQTDLNKEINIEKVTVTSNKVVNEKTNNEKTTVETETVKQTEAEKPNKTDVSENTSKQTASEKTKKEEIREELQTARENLVMLKMNINDTVEITENAKIYTYEDVISNNNGSTAYYDNTMPRTIRSFVLETNNGFIEVFSDEEALELLNEGATLNAVSVLNEHSKNASDIEGYYNVDNVLTLSKTN